MAIRNSTGLRNQLLGGAGTTPAGKGFAELLESGYIKLYTTPRPASADDAATGTLLAEITSNGSAYNYNSGTPTNGLAFGNPASGAIAKSGTWSDSAAVASGTAVWGRFYCKGDPASNEGASTSLARFDFSVGTSGADLNLSTTAIVAGAAVTIDSFTYTLPSGE